MTAAVIIDKHVAYRVPKGIRLYPGGSKRLSEDDICMSACHYKHNKCSLMLQSPGRDSPGSSGSGSGSGSRHSTASLDSGRASGSHLLGPRAPGSTLSSSPRCSISSSSIVSSDHGGPGGRVERLMHQGVPVSWQVVGTREHWDRSEQSVQLG